MGEADMVIRMRIYLTNGPNPDADDVFYRLVKPVHEKHGARFIGRYVDQEGRHIVMWAYPDPATMHSIQESVAKDEETVKNVAVRMQQGLHGVPFQEYIMTSTDPED